MRKGRCVVHELSLILASDRCLKAVWLDSTHKKVSFAFEEGMEAESEACKQRLQEVVQQHRPDADSQCIKDEWHVDCQLCERGMTQPMPENIELVKIPDAGVMLQKQAPEHVKRSLQWREFHWAHIRPRQFTIPTDLTTLSDWKKELFAAILCGGVTFIGVLIEKNILPFPHAVASALYVLAYILGAYFPSKEAIELLRKGILDVHFLMLCVAAGAAFIGHWPEGASLLFLFSLSGALEGMAMANTEREIQSLFKEAPKQAVLVGPDGSESPVDVDHLNVGMVLRVRPGEQFPVDAEILTGSTAADEANLTGEAVPIDKKIGDMVFSGTLNLWGSVDCRVTRPASESVLAKIITLIQKAQESKAPSQRFTDKFSTGYTYAILGLSLGMFFVWWLLLGVAPFASPEGHPSAFYRAMTLLVVASPCALVLSIPSAILAGIAAGARRGVLFRGGVAIEKLAEVNHVALDKTGTLTTGDLKVTAVQSYPAGREEDVLRVAASLGHHSTHPVSRAVARAWREKHNALLTVDHFKSLVGMGVEGLVHGLAGTAPTRGVLGRRSAIGEPDWLKNVPLPEVGITETIIECGDIRGRVLLLDQVREASAPLLRQLEKSGIKVSMLTGDRPEAARMIGKQLGISDIHSGLKPEQKVGLIQQWMKAGEKVAMVGDGVNDAPSLAAAHVAVGMGVRGSASVLEQADVVLMQDRLDNFHFAFDLSRRARRIINQNLVISLGVIVVLVASALGSFIPLTIGVIGHEGSTVIVVLNSLRLLIDRSFKRK